MNGRAAMAGARALLATAALLSAGLPARLQELPRPAPGGEPTAADAVLGPLLEPGREPFAVRVAEHLGERMEEVGEPERERLARALVAEADAARVDPLLVLAVIEVESRFDPDAVSHRGARGLMQLGPVTWRGEAGRAGVAEADPHDPVANVRLGVRYLARCVDDWPGRLDLALTAYNAGPNRLAALLREGGVPPHLRGYARRVFAEHARLERAFGLGPGEPLADAVIPGGGR